VELVNVSQRDVTSAQIVTQWRQETGDIPGVESLTFRMMDYGPEPDPIAFSLRAKNEDIQQLEPALAKCRQYLAAQPGVWDVDDDYRHGKWELQLRVKDGARAMGVSMADLAETLRASYFGQEVMRLQRGRHEVKLMVRYPRQQRGSTEAFDDLRVRIGDGHERPLSELAEVNVVRGLSRIKRLDGMRSINVTADVDRSRTNAAWIVRDMRGNFVPGLLKDHPGVEIRWEGEQGAARESLGSLAVGTCIAMLGMYTLFTLEFRSYVQPLLILVIVPFAIAGAIWGHAIVGLPLTLFSFLGLVALTGVVVNDSIVLMDFVNARRQDGFAIDEALVDAGRRRIRPILLTSATTIAGLFPILFEASSQAQVVIPMATSLVFGLVLSTFLILLMLPALYRVYYDVSARFAARQSSGP
jgi:multidrug efflux pump subunit AcrB